MLRTLLVVAGLTACCFAFAQPANDDICNATPLSLENGVCEPTQMYSWTNATFSSANGTPYCYSLQTKDVWYRVTVPASGQVTIATAANGFDVCVEVWKGAACGSATILNQSTDGFPCIYTSRPVSAPPTQTYSNLIPGSFIFLRAFSFDANQSSASLKLCVSNPASLADEPCNAGFINVSPGDPLGQTCLKPQTFTYSGATLTAGIPNPDCIGSMVPSNIRDVWMKVRVPASGKLFLQTPYNGAYYLIQVLSAPACNGTFTQVACALSSVSAVSLSALVPNSVLYLRVFYWSSGINPNGTFNICAEARNDIPAVNNTIGKVGIGIDSPFTKLQVVGSGFFHDKIVAGSDIETRGNLIVRGNIINAAGGNAGVSLPGISNIPSIAALDSLQMTTRLGNKVSLYGALNNAHYGLGIQSGLMQLYTDAPGSQIAFGYGRSAAFTERMRIITNGENGMQVKGRMLLLNGTNDPNQTPGVWLYKPDNTAGQAFMGVHTPNNVGFYSPSPGVGWGFNFFNNTGNVGIGTSANPLGRLDVVGGPNAEPVKLVLGNRGGFGPVAIDMISDYAAGSQWTPARIRTNDLGGFHGRLEFYTNVPGQLNTMTKGLEVGNGGAFTATGAVNSWSDERLKEQITPFTDGLNVIDQINPVQFQYKAGAPFGSNDVQVGVVAQQLEKAAPYMVKQSAEQGVSDLRYVNNQAYVYLLINAVKELKQQVQQQQAEIEKLKNGNRQRKK
jgi:hypothetical protein